MADSSKVTKQAVLDLVVNNNKAMQALAQYDAQIKATTAEIQKYQQRQKEGEELSEEEANEYRALLETQKALKRAYSDTSHQVQKNIQQQTEESKSLKSLRGELSQLNSQYDELSRADRRGEVGQALLKQITEVRSELQAAEEDTGRFQRNVGNYGMKGREAFDMMAGGAGNATKAIGTAKAGMIALKTASGWIGLVVGILARIISKLTENEAAMKSVRQAMAPINALMTGLNKIIEKVTNALGKLAEKFMDWAKKIGLVSKAIGEQNELTKAEIALDEKRRQALVQNAEIERDVSELRAKVAQKDKYTYKERIAMLEDVVAKEKKVAQNNKEIAEEEYRIALQKSKLSANSKEDNDKLAELKANAIKADTDYNNRVRELNSQLAEMRRQESAAAQKQAKDDTAAEAAAAEEVKRMADVYAKEIEARLALAQEGSKEEMRLKQEKLDLAHEKEMEELAQYDNTEGLRRLKTEKYYADRLQLEQDYYSDVDALLNEEMNAWLEANVAELEQEQKLDAERVASKRATAAAIADAIGEVGTAMEAFADEDSALAKASKVLALAKIAINTGIATAAGIAQAQSVPFPANIAAIATTIGTIAGGMASAVSSVKSAKFASGGYVSGAGTATSDSIPARLSNGESVMTAQATSMFAPLLSSLNQIGGGKAIDAPTGGSGMEALEQAVARGMRAANIKVSVTEINEVQAGINAVTAVANV